MLFLLAALVAPALADEPPVAMVLTTRGEVRLERGGAARPVGPTDLLRPGDCLVAGDGELRLVALKHGHQERLKAKSRVTVQEDGCTPADAVERQAAKLSQANLESLRDLARSSRAAIGVLRPLAEGKEPADWLQAAAAFKGPRRLRRGAEALRTAGAGEPRGGGVPGRAGQLLRACRPGRQGEGGSRNRQREIDWREGRAGQAFLRLPHSGAEVRAVAALLRTEADAARLGLQAQEAAVKAASAKTTWSAAATCTAPRTASWASTSAGSRLWS